MINVYGIMARLWVNNEYTCTCFTKVVSHRFPIVCGVNPGSYGIGMGLK